MGRQSDGAIRSNRIETKAAGDVANSLFFIEDEPTRRHITSSRYEWLSKQLGLSIEHAYIAHFEPAGCKMVNNLWIPWLRRLRDK